MRIEDRVLRRVSVLFLSFYNLRYVVEQSFNIRHFIFVFLDKFFLIFRVQS